MLGLTDTRLMPHGVQFIPNMDGFPNGRRLEDDVTRIELQAVGGVVLAAIGLWYDDYAAGAANPVTAQLGNVLGFNTGIERNDTTFKAAFPYAQTPWSGTNAQKHVPWRSAAQRPGPAAQAGRGSGLPQPLRGPHDPALRPAAKGTMSIVISDVTGRKVATVAQGQGLQCRCQRAVWTPGRDVAPGQYIATLYNGRPWYNRCASSAS